MRSVRSSRLVRYTRAGAGGMSGGGIPGWVLNGASADLRFTTSQYYANGSLAGVGSLISTSRASTAYATNSAGQLILFGNNVPCITDLGLQVWEGRTNVILWSRDLTNAAWTKSNVTAALDQVGVDGAANSASSIVATAGNGTILQAITLASSARFQSVYMKRLVGSGEIDMTMDNGVTWTRVDAGINSSSFTRVSIPTQTLANPTVGFRIVANGDKVAVDFSQNENGTFASPPIPTTTTSAARAADNITATGALLTVTKSDVAGSVILVGGGTPNTTGVVFGKDGSNQGNWIRVSSASAIQMDAAGGHFTSANLGSGATSGLTKFGFSWDSSPATSIVGNNGTVVNGTFQFTSNSLTPTIGSNTASYYDGNIQRLTVFNSRLPDATLKAMTQ